MSEVSPRTADLLRINFAETERERERERVERGDREREREREREMISSERVLLWIP